MQRTIDKNTVRKLLNQALTRATNDKRGFVVFLWQCPSSAVPLFWNLENPLEAR